MLPLWVIVQIFYALVSAGYDVGLASRVVDLIARMRF